MTRIRLNNNHRSILKEYGQQKIASLIDRKKENQLYGTMLDAANTAIRLKYPEKDMVVLRKYELTRHDCCLKFQFPSGRVDGFTFNKRNDDGPSINDLPYRRGCGYANGDVFPMDEAFETAFDMHAKERDANLAEIRRKEAEFFALVDSAKTLDDVLSVIELPEAILERLGRKSTSLVALSKESLDRLKADFSLKAA